MSNYGEATNSTSWGNYYDAAVTGITQYSTNYGATWTDVASTTKSANIAWLLKTGHSDYTKRNNIYDLAGNLYEWSNEIYSSDRVFRGCGYNDHGRLRPAALRYNSGAAGTAYDLGFRCALYIK